MSSTYQKAREALGLRLRELRRDARLTGADLAGAHGWHRTKISKIENGKQTPSAGDLEAWAASCGASNQLPELAAALRSLEGHYIEYRRMFRGGVAARQRTFAEFEATATFIRNFETCFVPGLLQTPEYARYRLAEAITRDDAADDLAEAVTARMARQQILYTPGRRVHFVVIEPVLRLRLGPPEVLAGQLEKLAVVSAMRAVRFGVIPFEAVYPVAPVHGFHVFDDRHVAVETITAALAVTSPAEVGIYLRTFAELAEVAVYGRQARAVIDRAMDSLMLDGE